MSRTVLSVVLLCSALSAQLPPEGQPIDVVEITPETPIATVNGKKFTAGEFEMMVPNLSVSLRELAATNPKAFLEQYALGLNLQAEAEKMKLDTQWPYRQQLADARRQILVQAVMAEKAKSLEIDPDEIRKMYASRAEGYKQAQVKVIFVSRMGYKASLAGGPTETIDPAEKKAKIEKAAKEVRAGRDFVEAARQYSDDADTAAKDANFPYPIRKNSANVPQEIRDAVLSAEVGDIVGPVEHATGWYIFRVEEKGVANVDDVRAEIEKELRDEAVRKFVEENQKKSVATLDHQAFWDTFLAANKQAQERREKQEQGK